MEVTNGIEMVKNAGPDLTDPVMRARARMGGHRKFQPARSENILPQKTEAQRKLIAGRVFEDFVRAGLSMKGRPSDIDGKQKISRPDYDHIVSVYVAHGKTESHLPAPEVMDEILGAYFEGYKPRSKKRSG